MKNFTTKFKKTLFLISIICLVGLSMKSQTVTLTQGFDSYDGTQGSVAGWYFSWNSTSSPSYYVTNGNVGLSAPSYKFGINQDTMITPSFAPSNSLSFWCKGEGSTFSPDDTLTILWSPDSINWNVLSYQSSLPTTGTTLTFIVDLSATNLMFIFTKYVGNLAIDDVQLTYTSPTGIKENNNSSEPSVIYPNPANDKVFLHNATANNKVNIVVYDVLGNEINLPEQSMMQGDNEVNLSSLQNGIYFLKIYQETIGTKYVSLYMHKM
jgi:hypothetical protein